jgi:predicted nucleotidyltransferase
MPTSAQIRGFCEQLAREFHPEKIILFGSQAAGRTDDFSDVDLLVVMPFEGSPLRQAARIIARLKPAMAVDLIVRTPEQVAERLATGDGFMREIFEGGQVLYEAEHAGVG